MDKMHRQNCPCHGQVVAWSATYCLQITPSGFRLRPLQQASLTPTADVAAFVPLNQPIRCQHGVAWALEPIGCERGISISLDHQAPCRRASLPLWFVCLIETITLYPPCWILRLRWSVLLKMSKIKGCFAWVKIKGIPKQMHWPVEVLEVLENEPSLKVFCRTDSET